MAKKLRASDRDKLRKQRLKQHKIDKGKKHIAVANKRDPSHIGEIYAVHPSHVVDKKNMDKYIKTKGNANPRPVAVVKKEADKTAHVAQMYGNPGKSKQVTRHQRTKLSQTQTKKETWIDSSSKRTSERTGEKFKVGVPPLTKKKGRVHPKDLDRRNKAVLKTKKATKK